MDHIRLTSIISEPIDKQEQQNKCLWVSPECLSIGIGQLLILLKKFKNLLYQKQIIVVIIITILIPMHMHGQIAPDSSETKGKRFSFGYGFGLNVMGLSVVSNPEYAIHFTPHAGINIHISTNLYLNQRLDLMILAGILLNQRDIKIHNLATGMDKSFQIESVFLEFPIALKYKFLPEKNRTPYFLGCLNPRIDLVRSDNVPWQPATPLLHSFDVYPEIGFGMDFQLRKLKFGVELKFSMGLRNVNINPANPSYNLYASGIKSMHSNMIILCFNFE